MKNTLFLHNLEFASNLEVGFVIACSSAFLGVSGGPPAVLPSSVVFATVIVSLFIANNLNRHGLR